MSDPSPEQARLLELLSRRLGAGGAMDEAVPDLLTITPGCYRLALVRGAWGVPCRIAQLSNGQWQTTVDGITFAPEWHPADAPGLVRIALYGKPISEEDFSYLSARRDSAPPDDPSRNPDRRIDFNTLTPPAVPTRR